MNVKPIDVNWHSDFSIYASEPFLKAVSDDYGWLGGIDHSGKLRCILPYTVIRKSIFRMVRFRVETIALEEDLDIQTEKEFLGGAVDYFRSSGMDMIIPATTNAIFRTYPNGADATPYGSYIVDLSRSEETLWSNLSASHRRKVRLAKKKGVLIKSGTEHLKTAYTLVRNTFQRSAIKFMSFDAFKRMTNGLGEYVKVLIADYQGVAQGCVVIPFSHYSAYYVYGGSVPTPVTGANNMLHWEAIKQFRKLGVKRYDFVGVRINPEKGSKQEGLMMFKQRFGGQLIKGYMWKYAIRPIKFAVYSIAVRLLRGGDIVDNERTRLKAL